MSGCNTPASRLSRMANMPATPTRSIRISDDIWDEVVRLASLHGETATDFVLRAIRREIRMS